MPYLFSYGSLQQEAVQLYTFGRLLDGAPDDLPGYEPSLVPIDDPAVVAEIGRTHYANATFNGRPDSRVRGTVFEITDDELEAADRYEEPAAYRRIEATLSSGKVGWVYVHGGDGRGTEPPVEPESQPEAAPPPARTRLPRPSVVIRDHPGLWWLFALLFVTVGGAFVYLGVAGAADVPWWQAAIAFGMGAAAVAAGVAWAWRSPLSVVRVYSGLEELHLVQFGLFGRRVQRFAFADIRDISVDRRRDDDGSMIVRPALVLRDSRQVPLSELWRHDAAGVARAIARIRPAIRRQSS